MSKPTVLIAEPLAPKPFAWLKNHAKIISCVIESVQSSRAQLFTQLDQAQALVVRTYTIVNQELLEQAPNLRVIARAGVGLDNIDLDACKARNIPVVYTPSANTQAVVEYVTQVMLNAFRPITPLDPSSIGNNWHALREAAITPNTCVGSTLGIIGFGKIGSRLGRVAEALDMQVLYHDLEQIPESERHHCIPATLDQLAQSSDVISVHVDGRFQNKQFLSKAFFKQLKPNAIFINSSRGFVIDDQAASSYAHNNPAAQLILDVHSPEPITAESPYLGLPNVIRTPHIAAATAQAKENMSWVVRDVVRVLNGDEPIHQAF